MGVGNASLAGPWPEAWHITADMYGDRQILVPGEVPVRGQGLVEEQAAHREGPRSQDSMISASTSGSFASLKISGHRHSKSHCTIHLAAAIEQRLVAAGRVRKGGFDQAGDAAPGLKTRSTIMNPDCSKESRRVSLIGDFSDISQSLGNVVGDRLAAKAGRLSDEYDFMTRQITGIRFTAVEPPLVPSAAEDGDTYSWRLMRKPGGQEGGRMVLEHEALTERIIGPAIEVHRRAGPGFFESIYERPSSSS